MVPFLYGTGLLLGLVTASTNSSAASLLRQRDFVYFNRLFDILQLATSEQNRRISALFRNCSSTCFDTHTRTGFASDCSLDAMLTESPKMSPSLRITSPMWIRELGARDCLSSDAPRFAIATLLF